MTQPGPEPAQTITYSGEATGQPEANGEDVPVLRDKSIGWRTKDSTTLLRSTLPKAHLLHDSNQTLTEAPRHHVKTTSKWLQRLTIGRRKFSKQNHTTQPRAKLCFPHELIEEIIGFLHDRPKDLASCGRVCRTWSSIAIPILWRAPALGSLAAVTRFGSVLEKTTKKKPSAGKDLFRTTSLTRCLKLNGFDAFHGGPHAIMEPAPWRRKVSRWYRKRKWTKLLVLVGTAMPNLSRLEISGGPWLNDETLRLIAKSCGGTLQELTVRICLLISPTGR